MSQVGDDVLDITESEFSGFEEEDLTASAIKKPSKEVAKPQKLKSVVHIPKPVAPNKENLKTSKGKKPVKKSSASKKQSCIASGSGSYATSSSNATGFLNSLDDHTISVLREKLGISNSQYYDDGNFDTEHVDLNTVPNLNIEFDTYPSDQESVDSIGAEQPSSSKKQASNNDLTQRLIDSLFGDEQQPQSDWVLPKIKAKTKGPPIPDNLAHLVNVACTNQCDTESLLVKYAVPENCEMLNPPLVNNEIWKVLDKKSRTYDRLFQEIQSQLASGMVPLFKLIEILKPAIMASSEAKQLISDSLTMLGQVQHSLSIRRRYLIRPQINKRYKNLCNISMPVTTFLFGDDISKEMKSCDAEQNLGLAKSNYQQSGYSRSANRGRYPRNFRGRGRFMPYNNPPSRGYGRGQRGYRGGNKPTATAGAPNEGS